MKTLKFRKHLAELIKIGKKSATWRLFDDKNLSVGDEVNFVVWKTGEEFAHVKITFVKETSLGNLMEEDWEGHERFDSDYVMYKTYEKYYNCSVDADSPVKIIKFELL